MALQIKDRVWDTTSTTGTGTITLAGAPPNAYQSFGSVCSDGDTINYTIVNRSANEWEVGLGTYHSAGPTLARTTVLAGTFYPAATNFSAGTKDVFGDWPAKQLQPTDTLFHVKKYGTIGDGVADDTAAINSAIAALNTAGSGILYFPAGVYKVSSSLTSITATGTVRGDGSIANNAPFVNSQQASVINYTSNNTACFTTATKSLVFEDLAIAYTGVSTPVSGSYGIITTMVNVGQKIDCSRIHIFGFNISLDIQGAGWVVSNCTSLGHIQYGIHVHNDSNHDAGDWTITGSTLASDTSGAISIKVDSSGGGRIVNNKFNALSGGTLQTDHIHVIGASTSDLLIVGNSFENFTGWAIFIDSSISSWPNVVIVGNQIAAIEAATGSISVTNNSQVYIGGNVCSPSKIDVTNTTFLFLGVNAGITAPSQVIGSASIVANSGIDASGGIGGSQSISASTSSGNFVLNWSGSTAFPTFQVSGGGALGGPQLSVTNNSTASGPSGVTMVAFGGSIGDPRNGQGGILSNTGLVFTTDNGVGSGGSDIMSFRAGGFSTAAEVFQVIPAGQLKFTNSANFSANGSVATALTSVGPTGSHTTVQTWLTVQGSTGNNLYIPCF